MTIKINIDWLKDSTGDYSYARVVGCFCIVANLIWRFYMGIDEINNVWQAVIGCSGLITGVLLWLIELFRELRNISVKIGDKEYELNKEKIGFKTDEVRS